MFGLKTQKSPTEITSLSTSWAFLGQKPVFKVMKLNKILWSVLISESFETLEDFDSVYYYDKLLYITFLIFFLSVIIFNHFDVNAQKIYSQDHLIILGISKNYTCGTTSKIWFQLVIYNKHFYFYENSCTWDHPIINFIQVIKI